MGAQRYGSMKRHWRGTGAIRVKDRLGQFRRCVIVCPSSVYRESGKAIEQVIPSKFRVELVARKYANTRNFHL